jgi:hypothetical protein
MPYTARKLSLARSGHLRIRSERFRRAGHQLAPVSLPYRLQPGRALPSTTRPRRARY